MCIGFHQVREDGGASFKRGTDQGTRAAALGNGTVPKQVAEARGWSR